MVPIELDVEESGPGPPTGMVFNVFNLSPLLLI